jgi:hypothetical protein
MSRHGRIKAPGVPKVGKVEQWRDDPHVDGKAEEVASLGEEGGVLLNSIRRQLFVLSTARRSSTSALPRVRDSQTMTTHTRPPSLQSHSNPD